PRLVRRLAQRPREPGALLSLVRPSTRILLLRQPLELALQLAPALEPLHVERAVGQRRAHRAARLAAVRAVGEATSGRDLADLVERGVEPVRRLPELKLAHAWRIEHEATARDRHELPVRGRVPPATVFAHVSRREHALAYECVHESRLAHSGGAE